MEKSLKKGNKWSTTIKGNYFSSNFSTIMPPSPLSVPKVFFSQSLPLFSSSFLPKTFIPITKKIKCSTQTKIIKVSIVIQKLFLEKAWNVTLKWHQMHVLDSVSSFEPSLLLLNPITLELPLHCLLTIANFTHDSTTP